MYQFRGVIVSIRAAIIFIILSLIACSAAAELSCELTTSCSHTDILHLSDTTDAHAEHPSYSDFPYSVCCHDDESISTIGTSTDGTVILHLSDSEDAQAESPDQPYFSTDIHISASGGFFGCSLETSCNGWQACLLSLSDAYDAHLGQCGAYPYNLCCNLSYSNLPPVIASLSVQQQVAKFGTLRLICDGQDQDAMNDGVAAYVSLKTSGSSSWDRIDNLTMQHDGNVFYYDYPVEDDGNTVYDAECHLTDGYESTTTTEVSITQVTDDWDGDGVSDAEDLMEGDGDDLDSDTEIVIEIGDDGNSPPEGEQMIEFKEPEATRPIVSFNFNFSESNLELPKITVRINNTGRSSILIKGLTGINKTVNIPKVAYTGRLCVKDAEIDSLDEITDSCTGPDEYLFTACTGESISGIRCTDKGSYFEVAGLMHSAVKETGETRLEIWTEGSMQSTPVYFLANYSNATSGGPITGAECYIDIDSGGWSLMTYLDGLYVHSEIFGDVGGVYYEVNCTNASFENMQLNDSLYINLHVVPEFSAFTVIAALSAVVMFIIIQRRYRR